MKHLLLALAFIFSTNAIYAQSDIECETDEFKGTTTCRTDDMDLSASKSDASRAILDVVYNFEHEVYFFVLTLGSSDWQYLNTDRAYFLIDGNRENHDLLKVDTDVSSGTVIEQYAIRLIPEDFKRFAEAEQVRFKIDNDEYSLPSEGSDYLNSLIKKVEEM